MFIRKFIYKLRLTLRPLVQRMGGMDINWGYWIFSGICLVFIILLMVNMYRIVVKGYQRYEIIQEENTRLAELISKNEQLKDDLKFYLSKEFVDLKAREELNMAFPNQRLVYVDRKEKVEVNKPSREKEEGKKGIQEWLNLIF